VTYSLRQLDGQLLRWFDETTEEQDEQGRYVFRDDETGEIEMWSNTRTRDLFRHVDTVAEADGVRFLCPNSYAKNNGPVGTHSVYIFFQGTQAPDRVCGKNKEGQPVRWKVEDGSTCLDDLSLTPSILEQDDERPPERRCSWHGFVGSNGIPRGHAG
jgi:hypothetical protein